LTFVNDAFDLAMAPSTRTFRKPREVDVPPTQRRQPLADRAFGSGRSDIHGGAKPAIGKQAQQLAFDDAQRLDHIEPLRAQPVETKQKNLRQSGHKAGLSCDSNFPHKFGRIEFSERTGILRIVAAHCAVRAVAVRFAAAWLLPIIRSCGQLRNTRKSSH
jgi:hypothetical protein